MTITNPAYRIVRIAIGRSRRAWLVLYGMHAVGAASAIFSGIDARSLTLVAIALAASLAWHHRRGVPGLAPGWSLVAGSDGGWTLIDPRGTEQAATLAPGGWVRPWLGVINLRLESGGRRALLMLPDNVDPESYRRLRVRLRFGAG